MNSMLDILKENTQDIKDNLKSVKSVQRGFIKSGTTPTGEFKGDDWVSTNGNTCNYIDLNISYVDINKSIILIDNLPYYYSSDYKVAGYFTSNTKIRLVENVSASAIQNNIVWQVIEFY